MRKTIVVLCLLLTAVQARGQGGKTFLQLNVTATSFYSNQERGLGLPQGLFGGFRSSPGIAFAVGRWVTPAVGLRLKMNGFGCKTVVGNDADGNSSRYLAVFGDVLLNVSSLILGDDGNRCWDVSPYVGGGINRNFTYDEYGIGLRLGVQGCWHFDRRWGVNLDIGYAVYEPDTDGIDPHENIVSGKTRHTLGNRDRTFGIELGITYRLGR